jgi:hypothetical protein
MFSPASVNLPRPAGMTAPLARTRRWRFTPPCSRFTKCGRRCCVHAMGMRSPVSAQCARPWHSTPGCDTAGVTLDQSPVSQATINMRYAKPSVMQLAATLSSEPAPLGVCEEEALYDNAIWGEEQRGHHAHKRQRHRRPPTTLPKSCP